MVHGERIGWDGGDWLLWGGFRWKPVPGTNEELWFRWSPKPGGLAEMIREDEIPDALWVALANRALGVGGADDEGR